MKPPVSNVFFGTEILDKSIPIKAKLDHLTSLKERGLDFNQRLSENNTILHELMWAVDIMVENESDAKDFLTLINFLLDNGADPRLTDIHLKTPLLSFAYNLLPPLFDENTLSIVKFLSQLIDAFVKHGLDINAKDKYGMTAINYAVKDDNVNLVRALIEKGANLNLTNGDGLSLLHVTIACSLPEITQLLIDAGVNLNVKNRRGETPLVFATAAKEKLYQVSVLNDLQTKQLEACEKIIDEIETKYKAMRELLRQRQALSPSIREDKVDNELSTMNSPSKHI